MIFSNPGAYSALSWFFEVLALAALIVEVWAFIDAIRRPSAAFVAASKQTTPVSLGITGVATAIGLGTVASTGFAAASPVATNAARTSTTRSPSTPARTSPASSGR